jgi:hypothetical protein
VLLIQFVNIHGKSQVSYQHHGTALGLLAADGFTRNHTVNRG